MNLKEIKEISSKDNQIFKNAKKIKELKVFDYVLIEGLKLIQEALQNDFALVDLFLKSTPSALFFKQFENLLKNQSHFKIYKLTNELFKSLSINDSPNELIAVFKTNYKEAKIDFKKANLNILVLDNIQEPGNVGTILRTGFGLGVDYIVLHKCVDLKNHKLIKASMGASFKNKIIIVNNLFDFLNSLKKENFTIFGTALGEQSKPLKEIKWTAYQNKAIIIGNEGHGLNAEVLNLADELIKIPMHNQTDSLNVAVATGIICYFLKNIN